MPLLILFLILFCAVYFHQPCITKFLCPCLNINPFYHSLFQLLKMHSFFFFFDFHFIHLIDKYVLNEHQCARHHPIYWGHCSELASFRFYKVHITERVRIYIWNWDWWNQASIWITTFQNKQEIPLKKCKPIYK